jgi:hypothetical protein
VSYATLVVVHDPYHPARHREVRALEAPGPLSDVVPETTRPHILMRNGQAVLRKDWDQAVERGDLVVVVMLPQGGGGGSNPLKAILQLAVMIFAPEIGAFANLQLFSAGSGLAFAVSNATLGAAIGMVGAALVSPLISAKPSPSSSSAAAASYSSSPTYSLTAQGNAARLEAPIPVQYGRMLSYPDFAALPYVEYAGNEQYLYQLLCIGAGQYEIETIRIADTAITNFEDVETQIVEPGGTLTLFPANVVTSEEVSGQEALTGTWLGPFTANAAETTANFLGVDVVAPRGIYYANDSGGLNEVSMTFTVQARAIDANGNATSGWSTLGTHTLSGATATAQRYSYKYSINAGRYEVRLQRTDVKQTSTRYGHELDWSGLRAYLPETRNYGNVTLLAVKMRATNNLSSQSSRKINVISTRKLPIWNGSSWSAPTATRAIAWALADAARNAEYGGGLADSRLDLDGLLALSSVWTARGDRFDARFDTLGTLWDALTQIGRAGRSKPYMQGGLLYVARDQAVTVPVAMYSMRNIVKGSFGLEYITPSDDTADSVSVGYYDANAWTTRRVPCVLPDSTSSKPAKIDLFGVTNRDHAYREGLYFAAANRYRRTVIKFTTEMEGFIPSFADLIAVSHDMPQWGQSFECVAWNPGTRTLRVSEPITWEYSTNYVALRRRDGSVSGPYVVTQGADPYHIVFTETPDIPPYTGLAEERTQGSFGWGDTWAQLARVVAIRPRDMNTVEIEAINEDPSVHTADQGVVAPPVNSSQLPTYTVAPRVFGLTARSMPGHSERMILSWQPSPWANYYEIEQSGDGINWVRSGEPSACNYTATALYGGATILRVRAVGLEPGPWVQVNYSMSSDYMWTNDANAMWTNDNNLMWRY